MNFIHMKYSQYIDKDLPSYVHILTNRIIINHYNIMYLYAAIYQSKSSFYERNRQPHVHISWGEHEALYLANHVVLCSQFMEQSCIPKYHVLWRMFSALYQYYMSIYQSYISLISVLYHLIKYGFMRSVTCQ